MLNRNRLVHHFQKNINRARIIGNAAIDFLSYWLAPAKPVNISKEGFQTYLFVCHDLSPHFPRLVKWMVRNANIHPVLLVAGRGKFKKFNIEHYDQVFTFRTVWQLRQWFTRLKGYDVVYTTGAIAWPMRVAVEKASAPVIFDVKDTYIVNYGFHPPKLYMKLDLKNEEYTFRYADGIVSQSIEAYFAFRFYGINKRPPTLFFPLYIDDDNLAERPPAFPADEIHLVYVGGVYGSSASKSLFGNEIFFDIIDRFSAQQIHFHLYPSPVIRESVVNEYKAYAHKTPYLHVHDAVPQDLLAREIAQYHFGLIPFFDERTTKLQAKRQRATALKVFNYMEAGLPVIISNHVIFEKWMVSRYGSAIGIEEKDLDRLREVIKTFDYDTLRRDAIRKRQNILLSKHIHRHLHFCQTIISKGHKNQ